MSRNHKGLNRRLLRRFRLLVLEAAGWRCQSCGKAGRLEADHIQPLEVGGAPYDPANGQALCIPCHIAKTRRENENPDPGRDAWRELIKSRLDAA